MKHGRGLQPASQQHFFTGAIGNLLAYFLGVQ
jgi:hypothetical protein